MLRPIRNRRRCQTTEGQTSCWACPRQVPDCSGTYFAGCVLRRRLARMRTGRVWRQDQGRVGGERSYLRNFEFAPAGAG